MFFKHSCNATTWLLRLVPHVVYACGDFTVCCHQATKQPFTLGKNNMQRDTVMQRIRNPATRTKVTTVEDTLRSDSGTATTQQMTVL